MKKTEFIKNWDLLEKITNQHGFPLETAFSRCVTDKGGSAHFELKGDGYVVLVNFKLENTDIDTADPDDTCN